MMVIDPKYDIGETVYLKTDKEQELRIVFAYIVYRNEIVYQLACGVSISNHYEFEVSREKDVIAATTN
jgi:hypothetical protein